MTLRYPVFLPVLGLLFAALFLVLAWAPVSRSTWALENALTLALLAGALSQGTR